MRLPFSGSVYRYGWAGILLLASAAAVTLLATPAAQAQGLVVDTSVGRLNVQTVQGAFGNGTSVGAQNINLTSQLWWGRENRELANEIAGLVQESLGLQPINDPSIIGPFFAYEQHLAFGSVTSWVWYSDVVTPADTINVISLNYYSFLWAYAVPVSPVPAPLPLLGVGAAFGFSRKLRKRIKSSKLPVASASIEPGSIGL